MTGSVLVGIATHNRADVLIKALASAQAQSYRPLRIAVVDDASGDDTPACRQRFPAVTWVRWNEGRGHVQARNHMMLTAQDDYFVSLDDDAWFVAGDELAVAVDYLERNPHVAALAFDILSPDRPDPKRRGPALPAAMFVGCGHVLRLSAVKQIGGYTQAPGDYGSEEKDLCLRLIDAGYAIAQLVGVHVWHDKTTTARDAKRQHASGVCNDLAFELRRCPPLLLMPVLTWKMARHVLFARRHGLLQPCLAGITQFFGSLGATWRGRRPVRLASYTRYLALLHAKAA